MTEVQTALRDQVPRIAILPLRCSPAPKRRPGPMPMAPPAAKPRPTSVPTSVPKFVSKAMPSSSIRPSMPKASAEVLATTAKGPLPPSYPPPGWVPKAVPAEPGSDAVPPKEPAVGSPAHRSSILAATMPKFGPGEVPAGEGATAVPAVPPKLGPATVPAGEGATTVSAVPPKLGPATVPAGEGATTVGEGYTTVPAVPPPKLGSDAGSVPLPYTYETAFVEGADDWQRDVEELQRECRERFFALNKQRGCAPSHYESSLFMIRVSQLKGRAVEEAIARRRAAEKATAKYAKARDPARDPNFLILQFLLLQVQEFLLLQVQEFLLLQFLQIQVLILQLIAQFLLFLRRLHQRRGGWAMLQRMDL
eukprot:s2397_g21.t1